jgi:hypothetical protein
MVRQTLEVAVDQMATLVKVSVLETVALAL